jgi:hypothetical protein
MIRLRSLLKGSLFEQTKSLTPKMLQQLLSPFDYNQYMIAQKTIKMPGAMANVMGGPSKEEAMEILKNIQKKYGLPSLATEASAPKDWQCQECGRLMTTKAAERAMFGDDGCPGCGGTDIDLASPKTIPSKKSRSLGESEMPTKDVFPKTDNLEIQLGDGRWVRVDPMVFRSWSGPRRRNGKLYKGPRYLWLTDEPTSSSQATRDVPFGESVRLMKPMLRSFIREEVRRVLKEDEGSLFSQIKHGSRVTIVNKFGQEIVGKAVMLGPAGWVINIGGRYGTPAIASPENVIRVKN